MKNVWKKIVLQIDGGFSSSVVNGFRLSHRMILICHMAFLNFGQNKLKSMFVWEYVSRLD
jgi:hypothetical protein